MTTDQKHSGTMNALLWTAQGLAAITLTWAGVMKILRPEQLPFPWIKDHTTLVWLTGLIDLAAGIGIIVPALLNIKPRLTVFAAYGIILLMTAAIIFHISRNEAKDIGFNIFLAAMALFIAWGRGRKATV